MAKKSKREEHWYGLGFIYYGTGIIEAGMKKNPAGGDQIKDMRKIDVLIEVGNPMQHNFLFSDPLVNDGKPFTAGASGNLESKFRQNLKKETCLPDRLQEN